MKNVILSADADLIDAAQQRAAAEGTTLDALFRRWLAEYVERGQRADKAMAAIRELRETIHTGGRRFSRDEMNERQ